MEVAARLWVQGRPNGRIGSEVLIKAGLNAKQVDAILALADEAGNPLRNANALEERLDQQVPGVRTSTREAVQQYLREHGLVDARQALGLEEVLPTTVALTRDPLGDDVSLEEVESLVARLAVTEAEFALTG